MNEIGNSAFAGIGYLILFGIVTYAAIDLLLTLLPYIVGTALICIGIYAVYCLATSG